MLIRRYEHRDAEAVRELFVRVNRALAPPGMAERQYQGVLNWAKETKLDGSSLRVIDQQWVQVNLARVKAKLEYLKLINWQVAANGMASVDLVQRRFLLFADRADLAGASRVKDTA